MKSVKAKRLAKKLEYNIRMHTLCLVLGIPTSMAREIEGRRKGKKP